MPVRYRIAGMFCIHTGLALSVVGTGTYNRSVLLMIGTSVIGIGSPRENRNALV